MERARLTKDGTLIGPEGAPVADPLPLLSFPLELDEGCSLRSFLFLLKSHPVLQALSRFLPAAVEDMEKCPASGCCSADLPLLVFGKTMELIGFPGKARAEIYPWLRGLASPAGQNPTAEGVGICEDTRLATLMEADQEIRFIPLETLLDTPLALGGLKHVVLGDVNRQLFCESRFTLFEVVDGLAWELGFRGGTQQCSLGR